MNESSFSDLLDSVLNDIHESFISERMQAHLVFCSEKLARESRDHVLKGIRAIQRALALNCLLAAQRLLQGTQGDRSSLAKLLESASLPPQEKKEFEGKLKEIRHSAAARSLQESRNAWLAHSSHKKTVRQTQVRLDDVTELLFSMADFVERLDKKLSGRELSAHSKYDEYSRIAPDAWGVLLAQVGVPDQAD